MLALAETTQSYEGLLGFKRQPLDRKEPIERLAYGRSVS